MCVCVLDGITTAQMPPKCLNLVKDQTAKYEPRMAGPVAFSSEMPVYTQPNQHEMYIFSISPCQVLSSTFGDVSPELLIDPSTERFFPIIFLFFQVIPQLNGTVIAHVEIFTSMKDNGEL